MVEPAVETHVSEPASAAAPPAASPSPAPAPVLSAELLDRLRTAHEDAGAPPLAAPKALSLIAHALMAGSDLSLGRAIYQALMQGFDQQQLVDRVTPVLVGYVGVEVAPRFHRTVLRIAGILAASPSAGPVELEGALSRAFPPRRFDPERGRAVLADGDLAAVRAGYEDEVLRTMGGSIVRGQSRNMKGFTDFLDSPVYDAALLDPRLREAMIVTVMASRADVFGMAVHFYAAIGVGLGPDDLRDLLASVDDESRLALATSVLEGVLILLASAIGRRATAMGEILSAITLRFRP